MSLSLFLTIIIWFFILFSFVFSAIKGRNQRILSSFFFVVFVTFFSLLQPCGKVLLTLGSLRITFDSLILGLRRSGVLVGTVFLSRLLVNSRVKRNGTTRNKLSVVFFYLNLLTEKKIPLKFGHVIEAIDSRLCEIWEKEIPENAETTDGLPEDAD